MKKFLSSIICITLILLISTPAFACTGIYVGSEASEDGTIIIARSNDNADVWPNYMTISDRIENQPGRTMPVDNGKTVFAPIPDTTYKYTATPWMDSTTSYNGLASDASCGTNEYGVSMTMAVTAFTNKSALEADPEPENGLTESTANPLVICQSKTARDAVEVLLKLIDTYGSSESNIALIADQTEAWYVEIYTGHEYVAVKLPDNMVSVFGNEFTLEYLSDYDEAISSSRLETLPAENGFAVYGDNGELNLMKTYAADTQKYCHMRTWIGHKVLSPSNYADYSDDTVYPLVFSPESKVSLQDVMELMRNRFEGTEYSPDETGRPDMRVIGTDTAMSVHILQTYPDLPAEMSCVTWESTSPAIYGVFVPLSNYCTEVGSSYGLNQSAEEFGSFDTQTYPWYALKGLTTLCMSDKRVYGAPVRSYWHDAETNMISVMNSVLHQAAIHYEASPDTVSSYVTSYCNSIQEQAFSDAKVLFNDVLWYQAKNSNTLKLARNPETHQYSDELVVHDPLSIALDGSVYSQIPDYSEDMESSSALESGSEQMAPVSIIIVVAILLAEAFAVYYLVSKKEK